MRGLCCVAVDREVSRQSALFAARVERGHAQADGFCQSCLPVVVGHECGRSQDKRSCHVQDVERANAKRGRVPAANGFGLGIDVGQIVDGQLPEPGGNIGFHVGPSLLDNFPGDFLAKDLEVPCRDQLDPVQMGQHRGRANRARTRRASALSGSAGTIW